MLCHFGRILLIRPRSIIDDVVLYNHLFSSYSSEEALILAIAQHAR